MVNEPCYEKKEIDKLINDLFKNKLIPKESNKDYESFFREKRYRMNLYVFYI